MLGCEGSGNLMVVWYRFCVRSFVCLIVSCGTVCLGIETVELNVFISVGSFGNRFYVEFTDRMTNACKVELTLLCIGFYCDRSDMVRCFL